MNVPVLPGMGRVLVSLTLLAAAVGPTAALGDEPRGQAPAEAMRRWQEMRFGMFIHWGPVSLKGTEIGWSRGAQVPIEEYDNLYTRFAPDRFDAEAWAATAKAAGAKYIVFTTKHHDGFCMWDTKQTDYNVMRSPFGRDVVKELAAACKKQGLALGLYHSVCDWHHPDFPLGSPGGKTEKPNPDLDRYNAYLKAQVAELLKNYGPLLTIWFDVPQKFDRQRGEDLEAFVRALQPDVLINNRSGARGDYDTPEQRVGAFQIDRPWETCMTIARQWSWKPDDTMKPLSVCLQTLVRCAGGDGNLLFNVGPMPNGEIEPRQVERLKEMGAWLDKYGESIYGTRGGPYRPHPAYASTRKGRTVYLHVLNGIGLEQGLTLPKLPARIQSASLLTGGKVEVEQGEQGLVVRVPAPDRQEIDTIVKLELDQPALEIPPIP